MKRNVKLWVSAGLLLLFVFWTVAVKSIDVAAIGPEESTVGFSGLNGFIHNLTGTNFILYTVTDWLGLVPIATCLGFAILGLCQMIKRKSISKVDRDILLLGGFYLVVTAVYILFEYVVINRRPILINGYLEVSYPSSTTMLVMCVMPTAMMQLDKRISNKIIKHCINTAILIFTIFMVSGRLISGVHWVTDIIGGALCSGGLVMMYAGLTHSYIEEDYYVDQHKTRFKR